MPLKNQGSSLVSKDKDKVLHELASGVQQEIENEMEKYIAMEAGEYHNDLVPFSQHATMIREKAKQLATDFATQLEEGQKLLKELFEKEEKNNPNLDSEVLFARWEDAIAKLPKKILTPNVLEEDEDNQSLQEKCGISEAFMNRAHDSAKTLMEDKRFLDASHVFKFLRILNPAVFDYYLGEANALVELGQYEDANSVYAMSLLFQPDNPYVIYQIATCLFHQNNLKDSAEVFDYCIDICKTVNSFDDLLHAAENARELIKTKKAA